MITYFIEAATENAEAFLFMSFIFAGFCLYAGHKIRKSRENRKWLEFVNYIDSKIS